MTLHIHRADRTDLLADGLGALLADPPSDPFAEELVLVSARGMERWLSQRLSHVLGRGIGADGVCAGVSFRSPASLIAEITGTGDDDPWSPEAMTWPLLETIDAGLGQDWCRTLATHLAHDEGRRYAVAHRLARLFASYAKQRPQMLRDWQDDIPGDIDADLLWQPPLWRALASRVDADPPHVRHHTTLARLNDAPSDLPQRLSLFGHTRLPAADIELLQALSTHHDLHLWLPHPSDNLWQAAKGVHGAVIRREDTSRDLTRHPLLDTLGRDLRELQRSLPDGDTDECLPRGADAKHPDTLLGWLQSDIGANEVRPGGRTLRSDDRSVQVHSCHGAARQIDALREVLLGLLADDGILEPRDILVMCPDVETYAPLIVAAFGLGDVVGELHPAHHLRVRLADRALTQTNPLFGTATRLLDVAGSRATASQVLDLAEAAPVRARFGFTDDDLETISSWVRQSGIRWGFDKRSRAPFGLDQFLHNTWRFGVDRILTGVAMSDDSQAWLDTALPLDDVGSNSAELAGRFAEFVDRLSRAADRLVEAQPLSGWLAALCDGVDSLSRADDDWQSAQLQREFAKVLSQAGSRADTELRLSDVRALLADHLAGRPTRANFRTGTLTVCTMVPMRSVPHRVVCLVGLDDSVFPRIDSADGDDVLARRPLTGERDIRSEDRQLLLDAICAATDTLVVTYNGTDEHSGHRRPASVPLAELLDALDATTSERVRERIVIQHPLQPFDRRNCERGAVVPGEPFTFDPTALTGARAATGARSSPPRFLPGALPELPLTDVSLDDLLTFFKDPVKGFFRALDYTLPWEVEPIDDAMPVEIGPLQEWAVGERMVTDLMRGVDLGFATKAEWRRGTLPPGKLGWRKARAISNCAAELAMAALRPRGAHPAKSYDIDAEIDATGRRVTGTVTPVWGDRTVSVTYSRLAAKHLLQAWISLVALAAQRPDRDWEAYCVGRDGKEEIQVRMFRPPPNAPDVLRDIAAIFDVGRREPLPLPLKTSWAWAQKRHQNRDPRWFANSMWESPRNMSSGEDAEQAHVEVWGARAPLAALLADKPRPGEEVDGEDTRLGALAARLWLPMLTAEGRP